MRANRILLVNSIFFLLLLLSINSLMARILTRSNTIYRFDEKVKYIYAYEVKNKRLMPQKKVYPKGKGENYYFKIASLPSTYLENCVTLHVLNEKGDLVKEVVTYERNLAGLKEVNLESTLDLIEEVTEEIVEDKVHCKVKPVNPNEDFTFHEKLGAVKQHPSCNEELSKNFYPKIEKALKRTEDYGKDDFLNSEISSCIAASLSSAPHLSSHGSAGYYNCPSSNTLLKNVNERSYAPLCVSSSLTSLLSKEIQMAASCLNIDPKEVLPIFNHESHFSINASSYSGAGGVGQLTKIAIEDVNQRLKQYQNKMKQNGCPQNVIDGFNSPWKNSGYTCSRITPPDQPHLNIFYSMMYYKTINSMAALSANSLVENFLKQDLVKNIPDTEKIEIKNEITRLIYNAGPVAIRNVVENWGRKRLKENKGKLGAREMIEDIRLFMAQIAKILNSKNLKNNEEKAFFKIFKGTNIPEASKYTVIHG